MSGNKVEIEVSANVTGQGPVTDLGAALDSTGQAAKKLGTDAGASATGMGQAQAAAATLGDSTARLGSGMASAADQIAKAKTELLALLGVGAGLQGIKDLSSIADSFKNLEARIKLTTGAGQAFDSAFQGVFDVAKRTNSAVEETGVLFTKLAEAGKTLGVSQLEALKLTETINQSIQLSGASAEASKASIIQLVQGLQSGVLRGDEFNSVMEQSPRLAKALADGLGVTTGELRKMAEAGQLTSATVVKALQSQSDAVQAEFGKLPATVGRAMQNLTTAFTAYVGEADKAGGYTAKLAHVIDGLAGNLSTVATVLIHTGQVMAAMKVLSMAQDWLSASNAIKATAASTEAATAATVRGTAAKVQNTTATVANTAAQTANAVAWNDVAAKLGGVGPKIATTGAAAADAAPKFGILGAAVGGLMRAFAPLLALDLALNFKSYGTAIGEFVARLTGAKDRTQELAAADKQAAKAAQESADARKRLAVATKDAADRAFGLTKEGAQLITLFDDMRAKGETASAAIASIGKDFDLSTIPGIRSAASVLDKLVADGKLSAEQFQTAWSKALEGQDLVKFEASFRAGLLQVQHDAETAARAVSDALARGVSGKELDGFVAKAQAAMALATREAERFEQAVGAKLQEAVRRTGLDMDVISGGMGKAAQSAINDTETIIQGLDKLKAQGVDTGRALEASLSKGINTADTQKALDAVRAQIEAVRKALGDQVADGLLDQAKQRAIELADALDKAKPGINSVREAMKELGVVTDQTLKDTAEKARQAYEALRTSGTASVRELREAFVAYAQSAIAANNGVATEALKVEAAMRGVTISAGAAGKAIVSSMEQGAAAIHSVEDAYHQLGLKTPDELNKIASANAAAWDKIKGDANASAETLKTAFATYAQSAIAASGSVGSASRIAAEQMLVQEAAVKGLSLSYDAEGRLVVRTQSEAAAAINGATDAIKNQKGAVDALTASLEAENAALERKISAQEKANDLKQREIDLENKRLGRDRDGFSVDADGKRIVMGTITLSDKGIYQRGKENGLTDEQALRLIAQFGRGLPQTANPANPREDWNMRLMNAIEEMVLANAQQRVQQEKEANAAQQKQQQQEREPEKKTTQSTPAPQPVPTPAQQPAPSTHLTINVAAGVDMSSRAQIDSMARAIMPAIESLQRKGLRA